jgi:hypothetical protein
MTENPYAPPESRVEDIAAAALPAEPPFFAVSLTKFVVLSVCTLGIYELYWMYRQWKLVRVREQSSILPFWRAFFAGIFCYSLFRRVREHPLRTPDAGPAAGFLAIGWLLTNVSYKLPEPYDLISFTTVLFLLPVHRAIAQVNEAAAPGHDRNAAFSAWNWAGVVLGGAIVVLGVIGNFASPGQ